jgi:hypothetical protein
MIEPPATDTEAELAREIVRLTNLVVYWKDETIAARKRYDSMDDTLRRVRRALGLSLSARMGEIVAAIERMRAGAERRGL